MEMITASSTHVERCGGVQTCSNAEGVTLYLWRRDRFLSRRRLSIWAVAALTRRIICEMDRGATPRLDSIDHAQSNMLKQPYNALSYIQENQFPNSFHNMNSIKRVMCGGVKFTLIQSKIETATNMELAQDNEKMCSERLKVGSIP